MPVCKQGMGGTVGVYSSPKACQQKGLLLLLLLLHGWCPGSTIRGWSCIPAMVISEHGALSLHAKWVAFVV